MRVLLTGGSGRLGTELRSLLEGVVAPSSRELDVTDAESVRAAVGVYSPRLIVHAAAFTDVAGAERERERCWRVNVVGTRNVALAAREVGVPLLHVSTDYVFWGDRGGYREDDAVGPVRNYYALSKLVAEEVARVAGRVLVVRTSFRPREWPYPKAFDDVFTGQDYVDVIAPEVARVIWRFEEIPFDTLHVVTGRKSVYELARLRKPDVERGSKREAGVELPDDISLDTSRWQALKRRWREAEA